MKHNPEKRQRRSVQAGSSIAEEPAALYIPDNPFAAALAYLGGAKVFSNAHQIRSKPDFIGLIRSGLSRKSLDYLMKFTGISAAELSGIFHTSDRTLRRYTPETRLSPEQSERAIELACLYSRGSEVFGNTEAFKQWMESKVVALNDKKPKEYLDTSLGIDMLMEELGRIEHGVFA